MEIKNDTNESPSNNELLQSQFLMRSASPRNQPIVKKQTFSQLPNGYANTKFFNRYARSQYILAGAVGINMTLVTVYFEMSLQQNSIKDWLLYLSCVFQFFCIFALFINYKIYNEFKIQQKNLHELGKPLYLAFYTLLILIRPYPFLQNYEWCFQNQLHMQCHKVNDLLTLCCIPQIIFIIPSIFIKSKFQSLRSQRISQMYGFKATYVYALKCWFKENSAFTISISFVLWWLVCSNSIRIAEYRSNPILKSLENSLWLTFITMSTAGLGDLYPETNIGYCLSTLAQYSGVTMLSIAVMLLRNTFELNSRQKRTLIILKNLQEKNQLRVVACEYIRESIWRLWRNRKNRQLGIKLGPSLRERNLKQEFKILKRVTQRANFHVNMRDEFKNNFAKVYGYIQNLKQNQETLINHLQFRK